MPNKEFLATFTKDWNDHDIDFLMAHMANECAFFASVGFDVEGTKYVGLEKVRKSFAGLWENYPNAHFEPVGEDFFSGNKGGL